MLQKFIQNLSGNNLTKSDYCRNDKSMYSEFFKIIMLSNSIFIVLISLYIIFSKRNEPNDYPENFSKTYVIKPRKKINNL